MLIGLMINSIVVKPVINHLPYCQKQLGFEPSPFFYCHVGWYASCKHIQTIFIQSHQSTDSSFEGFSHRLFATSEPPKTYKPSVQNTQKIRNDGQVTKSKLSEYDFLDFFWGSIATYTQMSRKAEDLAPSICIEVMTQHFRPAHPDRCCHKKSAYIFGRTNPIPNASTDANLEIWLLSCRRSECMYIYIYIYISRVQTYAKHHHKNYNNLSENLINHQILHRKTCCPGNVLPHVQVPKSSSDNCSSSSTYHHDKWSKSSFR